MAEADGRAVVVVGAVVRLVSRSCHCFQICDYVTMLQVRAILSWESPCPLLRPGGQKRSCSSSRIVHRSSPSPPMYFQRLDTAIAPCPAPTWVEPSSQGIHMNYTSWLHRMTATLRFARVDRASLAQFTRHWTQRCRRQTSGAAFMKQKNLCGRGQQPSGWKESNHAAPSALVLPFRPPG